jgi:hypothetical protein
MCWFCTGSLSPRGTLPLQQSIVPCLGDERGFRPRSYQNIGLWAELMLSVGLFPNWKGSAAGQQTGSDYKWQTSGGTDPRSEHGPCENFHLI